MEKVSGIGGLFFRSKDPEGLARWYAQHLGVVGAEQIWSQAAGPTVFAPFKADSDYFAQDKQWMINFRVGDLDALSAQLRDAGIAIETRAEWDDPQVGRFARIHDPEGNAIELWEPPKGSAA